MRHYHTNDLEDILYTHIRVVRRHQLPIKASRGKPWSLGKVLKAKYFCFVLRLWWSSKSQTNVGNLTKRRKHTLWFKFVDCTLYEYMPLSFELYCKNSFINNTIFKTLFYLCYAPMFYFQGKGLCWDKKNNILYIIYHSWLSSLTIKLL